MKGRVFSGVFNLESLGVEAQSTAARLPARY